jgi:MerR family transcriptional regulator, light-induced transcriptional regulator
VYSIKEAAARSGVSIPTLRAWERRYGVVAPIRTPSGYRLYDENAIARLRHMRTLVSSGWRPREAARRVLETVALEPTGDGAQPQTGAVAGNGAGVEALIYSFVQAAVVYDTVATEAVLDDIFARGSFEWAMEAVVFPALEQVGQAWANGELSVAAEHAASQAVFRRVAIFYEASGRAARPAVVIGLPPAARHDLGALAFAVAARRVGVGILFLGADVPVDSWISAIRDSGAAFAIIAVPTPADVNAAAEVVRALTATGLDVACLAGGSAADALPTDLDAVALPQSISDAARAVQGLVAARHR